MGVKELFPVQCEVIPHILRGVHFGGDVCVCAPTGSGKTLVYAIPIVQTLSSRLVQRLRALVLVPTRELALQVADVLVSVARGTPLCIETLYGRTAYKLDWSGEDGGEDEGGGEDRWLRADVLVGTPDELVECLEEVSEFSLCYLQFLVLDEIDRLLADSYQSWVTGMQSAINRSDSVDGVSSVDSGAVDMLEVGRGLRPKKLTMKLIDDRASPWLQTLIFSATVTRNPEKLAELRLWRPSFFVATRPETGTIFCIPQTISQYVFVTEPQEKPLVLLHILNQCGKDGQALCFAGSADTAHRLCLLLRFMKELECLNCASVFEYNSNVPQKERNRILLRFQQGKGGVLVASDLASRGLEFGVVHVVVNYDAPEHIKGYVHRVGRAGRAGNSAEAYTLVRPEEQAYFRQFLRKAENSDVRTLPRPVESIRACRRAYKVALRQLKAEIKREKRAKKGALDEGVQQSEAFRRQLETVWHVEEESAEARKSKKKKRRRRKSYLDELSSDSDFSSSE
ncbi:ATP-dependent RNA helicase DDX51-like [Schistocerca gregaria]|uniref:ATP-dependent RNA helicase DDX51-like n=1 Tax=Schistocerca gregaria TaxID=7010 RepID=UPI00211F01ED|nr:ATP-dependent RNA helicase DDX51-like [Schistocerca gregaria]